MQTETRAEAAWHRAGSFGPLDKSIKTSIKTKRLLAATSNEFRATLLGFALPGEDDEDDD
jgi:hypothetical protein